MIVYQADWVCPASSPPIENGCLTVDGSRIEFVGPDDFAPNVERKRYPGCAIIPGFVNAHTHLELTLFHGLLENLPFSEWISRLTRTKYLQCTRHALKVSAQLGAMEMLRAGVTTVGEVMDVPTGWEAMLEFGLQGIAYQEVFGPAETAAPESMKGLQAKVDAHRQLETETQRIGVSPHAPYSVSESLYKSVRDYARRERLRMTAHIAESSTEVAFVRDGDGTFAESHRKRGIPIVARHCSPIAYLKNLGILGPDMLLVHAIEAGVSDLEEIRKTGTPVAHCPKSNSWLGHRVAPVAAMRECGIPVCLGTDSVASNDAFDLFAEMRAVVSQQHLGFEEVFRMATLEGARVLGLERHVGSLERGKRADFNIVALADSRGNPLESMIRFARPHDTKATFLGGREVVLDLEPARAEVRQIQLELSTR